MILRDAYERGYKDGFVDATITDETGFPDASMTLKRVSGVNVTEGWEAHADSLRKELLTLRENITSLANECNEGGSVLADRILALFSETPVPEWFRS